MKGFLHGHHLAQAGTILAVVYIILMPILFKMTVQDAVYGGLALRILFSPVDISIIVDKFLNKKVG